jgi:hypothetical protein
MWANVRSCSRPKRVKIGPDSPETALPVYPEQQTCRCTALTDVMCQKRKSGAVLAERAFRLQRGRHSVWAGALSSAQFIPQKSR